jgi:MFS superfamily sulfate permease-like transporter
LIPVVVTFWRGGTTLIVFALAARYGAVAAAFGALAGLVAAAVATRAIAGSAVPQRAVRWACALALAVGAFVIAVQALRLT